MSDENLDDVLADSQETSNPGSQLFSAEEMASLTGDATEPTAAAFRCDEWDQWKGRDVAQVLPKTEETKLLKDKKSDCADFHALAYQVDPTLVDESLCTDKSKRKFLAHCLESGAVKQMRLDTQLNELGSEIAALEMTQNYAKILLEQKKKKEGGSGGEGEDKDGKGEAKDLAKIASAAKQASSEAALADECARGLGGSGSDGFKLLGLDQIKSLFQRVRGNSQLRRIMELAGRYRRVARAKQQAKTIHGKDDVVGVQPGGDLSSLVSSEFVQLGHPLLQKMTLLKILENQAMILHRKGIEHQGKGPIVCVVDESGSMSGEPVANAKAFALAMAWIARQQKRDCLLVGFSGDEQGTTLMLPATGDWDQHALLAWLVHFYSGGTEMDVPLEKLPKVYWKKHGFDKEPLKGKTDVIFLTDGQISIYCHPTARDFFLEWKKQFKVRAIGLAIGAHLQTEGLKVICDEVYAMRTVDLSEDGVLRCLEI